MVDPQDEPPAEQVVHLLLAIHRYLRRYAKQISGELGVSGRELSALRRLQEVGPLSVSQIGTYLYLADSTTSELLDGLEERGLVTRSRSGGDSRVAHVALTPAGQALVAQAPLGGIGLLRQRLRSLPPEEAMAVARALRRLSLLMDADAREPH